MPGTGFRKAQDTSHVPSLAMPLPAWLSPLKPAECYLLPRCPAVYGPELGFGMGAWVAEVLGAMISLPWFYDTLFPQNAECRGRQYIYPCYPWGTGSRTPHRYPDPRVLKSLM